MDLYRQLLAEDLGAESREGATWKLGLCQKRLGQYRAAIETFERILHADSFDSSTGQPLRRRYLSEAQWEIGNCYLLMQDYAKALHSYQKTEAEYPFQSFCGNAHWEFEYRYDLYKGLCYEHLGEREKAIAHYWKQANSGSRDPTIPLRLLDIYVTSGRTEKFRVLVEKLGPGTLVGTVLRVFTLGRTHNWPELIAMLKDRSSVTGPAPARGRRQNWLAIQAAQQLARAPDKTVPLLVDALSHADHTNSDWLLLALGYCATPEALDLLTDRAGRVRNSYAATSLVYSLSIAGTSGEARLGDLEETATGNLAIAIRHWRDGKLSDGETVPFPPLD